MTSITKGIGSRDLTSIAPFNPSSFIALLVKVIFSSNPLLFNAFLVMAASIALIDKSAMYETRTKE